MLDQILATKRAEVAARKQAVSLESLLARCDPSRRRLGTALRQGKPGFLLEIKFASPSAGLIRSAADLATVLESYRRHADAVSVLTDRTYFGGSPDLLARVRRGLDQPLLCKDFILEPYQVAVARAHGADAVLLILAAIDDAVWQACAALADQLGMEVLTEVHDAAEAGRAVALGARLIGINARNLRTLRVDPSVITRIAPGLPADRVVVAESGIESRDQVEQLRPAADAVLVGTALMREDDLDRAVRRLIYGRTKICGLTRAEDAVAARETGATHGGLVFAAHSPRQLDLAQARPVRAAAELEWVGVFADHDPQEISTVARELGLRAVQLHGSEGTDVVARVRARLPRECEVWKASPVSEPGAIPTRRETGADRLLLDSGAAGRGGTGRAFDWSLLAGYAERRDVVLAGGLGEHNVGEAAALGTWALDASSGVETAPGHKDRERLGAFFRARRRLPGRGDRTS
ncbi:MAG: bifunctional indole-3-glycerol-phosphate synthase TrpC/phosphoribosylanthranilate isomerase TrpF [Gemmatimonadales bacterium]